MDSKKGTMTTTGGNPIGDNQNSVIVGPRGPLLQQDYQLIEKLAHQNRERIPERPVHAKGSGAYGTFRVTHDITKYTKAALFSEIGKETPVFFRFSTVAGERGAADAHRYRVGTHYKMLPVNRPASPVNTYHMDGPMRFDAPDGPDAYYEPNSFNGPVQDEKYLEPPLKISGDASRYDHREGNEDYNQAGNLFRLMNDDQKQQLFNNLAEAMAGVPANIVERQLGHFHKANPAYAAGVASALGIIWKAAA